MSLPSNLVSEFVRITNDSKKTKAETTVYGTIVKDGDTTYAKLDGSNVLTPVSTTADTQHGERVTVLIKNHTATVTGNISSPAARTDDVQQLGGNVKNITEDTATLKTSVEDASKTATNFLSYDSDSGLQVGNKTGGTWSGFRTQATSNAFNILDSVGNVLASYGAKLIELGKNATDAIIKLCGGKGQIEYASDGSTSDSYLQLSSDKLRLKSDSMTSLYSTKVNESGKTEKSAVNVSPNEVCIYSSESNITMAPDSIGVSTTGDVTINASSLKDSYGEFISVVNGASGKWTYKKWSDGTVELWGSQEVSGVSCNTSFGSSMYRSDALTAIAFPFSVYSPNLTASYESDGYGAILWATSRTTETSPPSYYLLRATSGTISSGKITFHVFGKWTT